MADDRWVHLLSTWALGLRSIHERNSDRWETLGLPPLGSLRVTTPCDEGSLALKRRLITLVDLEVSAFYSVSDGWPMWLGSFWCEISPSERVDLFKRRYPEAFDLASSSAPPTRIDRHSHSEIGKDELPDAVVLSEPDARELVLSLRSGETCLYLFDSMRFFPNFYGFMEYQRQATTTWVNDVISGAK